MLQLELGQALLLQAILLIAADCKVEREHKRNQHRDGDQSPRTHEIQCAAKLRPRPVGTAVANSACRRRLAEAFSEVGRCLERRLPLCRAQLSLQFFRPGALVLQVAPKTCDQRILVRIGQFPQRYGARRRSRREPAVGNVNNPVRLFREPKIMRHHDQGDAVLAVEFRN